MRSKFSEIKKNRQYKHDPTIMDEIYKYFPYLNIRKEQKILIPNIYKFLHSREYDGMILAAGNGLGKTACFSSQVLLALEEILYKRAIFAIPTDIGKENILKEFRGVEHNKKILKVLSKDILCNWIRDKKDERITALEKEANAQDLCKLQGHICKYKEGGCLYELQKEKIKYADILVCDYNYFLSPFIRRASGFEEILKDNLLLIDECHMLKRRAETIFSSSLPSTTIERSIKELGLYGYKGEKKFIEKIYKSLQLKEAKYDKILKSQIKNADSLGEVVLQATDLLQFFGSNIIEDIRIVGERLIYIGKEISNLKFEQKKGIISYTNVIGHFILRFYKILKNGKENSNIFFLKLKLDSTIYIGWSPEDVRGFIRNAVKKAIKYVLYSGTIKPTRLRGDVGLSSEKIYIPEPIESPYIINRKDIILIKERFWYKNVNDNSFTNRIIEDLNKLFPHMEKPVGIICTNLWYNALNLSSKYPILDEPGSQEGVEYWLENLLPHAQFIRYNPFGRIAQSIDISPHLKSIMFLGVPYEKYGPIMQEKINKKAKFYKGTTGNVRAKATFSQFIQPAYERTIQSIMRGLRNENDRLVIIYYDTNFKLNKPGLESKNLVMCRTIDEVIFELTNN